MRRIVPINDFENGQLQVGGHVLDLVQQKCASRCIAVSTVLRLGRSGKVIICLTEDFLDQQIVAETTAVYGMKR